MQRGAHRAAMRWLSMEYHEQNGSHIDILERPPSPLEFARLVHISRPVVIKGFKTQASVLWSNKYLMDKLSDRKISIAITPNGRADAVALGENGTLYFVEPCVEWMTMAELIQKLSTDSDSDIYYLQSQNGNLYSDPGRECLEFIALRPDIPPDISWCSEAFDKPPDAVNLWIGNSRSVTSIHSDPYENIYTVVRGWKYFTLLPPCDGWCLKERMYPHARYTRQPAGLTIEPTSPTTSVRWSSVSDPHLPGTLPSSVHPIHVSLGPGDTLYLPPGWWHHVRQSEEITIAVNWWYDMEMRGMSWILYCFLRGIGSVQAGNAHGYDSDDLDLEDVEDQET